VKVNSPKRIISLLPNSLQPEVNGSACGVEEFSSGASNGRIKVITTKKPEGEIPLPEAELVVSAGRGLKGPENWAIVENLAKSLGAATACSRPVADIGWRPHHEHVGQTGVAIRPNLYIAAGISGAIQHLAGVNGSKVIVVINTDQEAPFFKESRALLQIFEEQYRKGGGFIIPDLRISDHLPISCLRILKHHHKKDRKKKKGDFPYERHLAPHKEIGEDGNTHVCHDRKHPDQDAIQYEEYNENK
jgi:hypothetical protein